MVISAPNVAGPISACNKSIQIKDYVFGAIIKVQIDGNPAPNSGQRAEWPGKIDLGVSLQPDQLITVTQEFQGEISDSSPSVIVNRKPTEVKYLSILSHLYECGRGMYVEGAQSGSELHIAYNGQIIKRTSIIGIARFTYEPGLQRGDSIGISELTCNQLTFTTQSRSAEPLPEELPLPILTEPLIECRTSIEISDVLEGATLNLYKNGSENPFASLVSDLPSITWVELEPLVKGDFIEAAQVFICKDGTKISRRAGAHVKSINDLQKPILRSPLCEGGTRVTVEGLKTGDRVTIFSDTGNGPNQIGMSDASDIPSGFNVKPLIKGAKITANITLCNKQSQMSDPVFVKEHHKLTNELFVYSPLYECARSVEVWNPDFPGSKLYVTNQNGDRISDTVYAYDPWVNIVVNPSLTTGQYITIVCTTCEDNVNKFGPYLVHKIEEFGQIGFYEKNVVVGSDISTCLCPIRHYC